ncbi:MAG: hypothetical protein ACRD1X_02940 [Vicinamibacteria bacterium]
MARETTIRTSSGAEQRGKFVREKKWQPSGADMFALGATFGISGAGWKRNAVTVKDKDNRYHTGRRVR